MKKYMIHIGFAPGEKTAGVKITDTSPVRDIKLHGSIALERVPEFINRIKDISEWNFKTLSNIAKEFGLEFISRG